MTGYTGLGLRVAGDGRMKSAVVERPSMAKMNRMMAKHGNGLRLSGGECEVCKGSGMNDNIVFGHCFEVKLWNKLMTYFNIK